MRRLKENSKEEKRNWWLLRKKSFKEGALGPWREEGESRDRGESRLETS